VTPTQSANSAQGRADHRRASRANTSSHFMLHYNFRLLHRRGRPGWARPGRREIDTARLAVMPCTRASDAVRRSAEQEMLSLYGCAWLSDDHGARNGSSSMATVCGASLSLIGCGRASGEASSPAFAMGLNQGRLRASAVLSDILAETEDHLGRHGFQGRPAPEQGHSPRALQMG